LKWTLLTGMLVVNTAGMFRQSLFIFFHISMSDSHDINDGYNIDPVALAYHYTSRYEDSLEITHYHLRCGTQLGRSNRSGVLSCAVCIWRVRTELYHGHHLVLCT
jgi:hypothetical protein